MGWYGGTGARRVFGPITVSAEIQPDPIVDPDLGLIECPWKPTYELLIGDRENWLSGVYLARFTHLVSGHDTYSLFVVRDDAKKGGFLVQRSLTTDQAYNDWGGMSLYWGNLPFTKAAYKVSFNRPMFNWGTGKFLPEFNMASTHPHQRGWEYSFIRWVEKEGYDVAYATNLDIHSHPELLMNYRAAFSIGHDEYWSWEMRKAFERARDTGTHLGFFSANSAYWQIRFEASPLTGEENRTLVCYKNKELDPVKNHLSTTYWRDPHLNLPEEELMGVMYDNVPPNSEMLIENTRHWVFRGTGLRPGDLIPGIMGYEVDRIMGRSPKRLKRLAHSPFDLNGTKHYGDTTLYQADSGAYVFAGGTIRWGFGLDDYGVPRFRTSARSSALEQMTRNILDQFEKAPTIPISIDPAVPLAQLSFDHSDAISYLIDGSGRENHGVSYGLAVPEMGTPAKSGLGLTFNGTHQYFTLPREASVLGTIGFSVALAIRTDSKHRQVLISQRDDDGLVKDWDFSPHFFGYDGEFQVELNPDGKVHFWEYNIKQGMGFSVTSNNAVNDGLWHSIKATRLKDGTGQIWVDGNLQGVAKAPPLELKAHTIFVGCDGLDRVGYFEGQMDDLKLQMELQGE